MTEDTAWRIAGALESLASSAEKFAASLARMAEDMTLIREMLQEDRARAAARAEERPDDPAVYRRPRDYGQWGDH